MRPPHPEFSAAQLRVIASRILVLAEEQSPSADGEPASDDTSQFDDCALVAIARQELELRQSRRCFLNGDLFGEPAWDILLALFVAAAEDGDLTIASASAAADVSRPVAKRCIDELEGQDLVLIYGCEIDKRITRLALTHAGQTRLRQALRHYGAIRTEDERPQLRPEGPPKLKIV